MLSVWNPLGHVKWTLGHLPFQCLRYQHVSNSSTHIHTLPQVSHIGLLRLNQFSHYEPVQADKHTAVGFSVSVFKKCFRKTELVRSDPLPRTKNENYTCPCFVDCLWAAFTVAHLFQDCSLLVRFLRVCVCTGGGESSGRTLFCGRSCVSLRWAHGWRLGVWPLLRGRWPGWCPAANLCSE